MNKKKCVTFGSPKQETLFNIRLNGQRKTIFSVNGDNYCGEWKDNLKHGHGVQTWKSKRLIYEGSWEYGKRSGPGVLAVIGMDGSHTKVYSGFWRENMRHGYGENWYSCNEFYEGEWHADKRCGWGRYYYKDGSMYEGEWLHDKRWGNGVLRLPNENRYEGGWIDDKKNGKGKYIFHATNQVMEGIWIDDVAKQTALSDLGSRMEPSETTVPIPALELQSPDEVWREAVEKNMRILREKYPTEFS